MLGIKVLLRAGACRPREELARSFTSPPQPDLDHALLFARSLLPAACDATSARSACTLRAESPRRTAVHFFPHTRPPDTHSHLSQQHTTPSLDSRSVFEYQGSLVNTYFSLVLTSMPGKQRRAGRSHHRPPGSAMMACPRDDEASEIASVDGTRDMSTSFAREGSGDFDTAKALAVLTVADKTATPARFKLRVSLHVVVSAAADAMAPPARRPLLVEEPLAAATLKNAAASGRKQTSPLTTLSASTVCTGTKTFRTTFTSFSTSSVSNSDGC